MEFAMTFCAVYEEERNLDGNNRLRWTFQSKILGGDAAPQRMLTLNLARELAWGPGYWILMSRRFQDPCQRLGR